MSRRSRPSDSEKHLADLLALIQNFEKELASGDLRHKVLSLVPVWHALRDLGSSLISPAEANSAHKRILAYLLRYPRQVVSSEELMIVAGIIDYQRRIRELRRESGWKILSGETAKLLITPEGGGESEIEPALFEVFAAMKPDDYYLVDTEADTDAARRWQVANRIRNEDASVRDRVIAYLRENVGRPVFGEELAYVAKNAGDWPRRTRELRTEFGWPITTKTNGRPDLPVGVYVLEEDRQAPEHDRHIPDAVRGRVLQRDNYSCQNCAWTHALWNPSDPRHLELHHIQEHVKGGDNTENNLTTLCTLCHDEVHAGRIKLR